MFGQCKRCPDRLHAFKCIQGKILLPYFRFIHFSDPPIFLKLIDIYYFVNFIRKNNTNYIDMILFVHILISNKRKVGSNKPTGKTKINKKEYELCL